jgi:hypothetical protein
VRSAGHHGEKARTEDTEVTEGLSSCETDAQALVQAVAATSRDWREHLRGPTRLHVPAATTVNFESKGSGITLPRNCGG